MGTNEKIVIYQTNDGETSIDVRLEGETVWLSANQMAALFDRDEKTIRKHINNVFSEGELFSVAAIFSWNYGNIITTRYLLFCVL